MGDLKKRCAPKAKVARSNRAGSAKFIKHLRDIKSAVAGRGLHSGNSRSRACRGRVATRLRPPPELWSRYVLKREALRFPLDALKGWSVPVRDDRCSRRAAVALRGLIRRRDRRLLADVLAALRCRRCRSKPAAALLTNARDPSDIQSWQTRETGKGRLQLVPWDDAARQ